MIDSRIRKILRDVWARKGRTGLVSSAIFIGVAGTIALFSMSDILISQLEEDIKPDELSMIDISVSVDTDDIELDNATYLSQIESVDTVSVVEARAANGVYFTTDEDARELRDFETVFHYGYDMPYENIILEPMRLVEGVFPTDNTQVAIEQRAADDYGVSVGDTVYFRPATEATGTDGVMLEPRTVSGIVFHAYAQDPSNSFYGTLQDSEFLAGVIGYGEILIRLESYPDTDDEAAVDAFDDRVDEIETIVSTTPYSVQFTSTEDPENSSLVEGAQILTSLLSTLALVSLVVSGFLVINVITSLVTEQRNQIGVMKALGATRIDNFQIYSGIAFAYGLIGVIPGIIVGIPLGYYFAQLLGPELNTLVGDFQVSIPSVIIGTGIGLAVPVFASIIPVFNGTRVTILEAMTDLGIDATYGNGPIARFIAILPIPTTVRQGLASVSIKKFRLAFTVVTLTIAVGSFIGIYGVFDSIRDGIGSYLDSFNTEIGFAIVEATDPNEFTALINDEFGVDAEDGFVNTVEPGYFLQVDFIMEDGDKYEPSFGAGGPPGIFAYGIDVFSDDPAFLFEVDEGARWTEENAYTGIVLTGSMARGMGVGIGDTVTMAVPGASRELEVIAISEYPIDQVYVNWEVLAEMRGSRYIAPEDRVPGVVDNEYFSAVSVEGYEGALGGAVPALGINTQFSDLLTYTNGTLFALDANELIISTDLAASSGFSVGDEIVLSSTEVENSSETFTVAGIFELPPSITSQDGLVPTEVILMFTPRLAALNGIILPEGVLYPQLYFLKTNLDDPSADAIDDRIFDMEERFLERGDRTFSLNFVEFSEQFTSGLFQFQLILSAVALLIAVIGALGLLTTLSMSVFERQKEIGVMRSIGAGSMTVAFQFLTEGLVVGILAWLLGLPVAMLIQIILFEVTGFGSTFELTFPIQGAVIGLVGTLIVTTIASFAPSLQAANRTVSDILRYQ